MEEAPLAELLTMGFPEQLSRNALLLHRNRLAAAVDWALSHVDDDAAAEPLSQEVLAAVYGPPQQLAAGAARRRQRRAVEADLEALQSMMSIGFDADQARDALVLSNNNLDEACRLLLLTSELARVSEGLQGFAGAGGGAQEAGRDSPPPLHDEEESEDGSEEGGEESSEEEMWHSGTEDSGEQSSSEEERAREGD